jgi:hypothetical protein
VVAEFDWVTTKFSVNAAKGDPEADGESIVGQPDAVRTGWLDAHRFAAEIDRLVVPLVAAGDLCGVRLPRRDGDAVLLPMVCDPNDLHRRCVWEARGCNGSRCRHWSALVALGVTIRAWPADQLAEFQPYRQPKPLVSRQFPRSQAETPEVFTMLWSLIEKTPATTRRS